MKLVNLRFQLSNPFDWDYFKNLGSISGRLSKNKYWELEHTFYGNSIVDCDVSLTTREDHAGFEIELGLLGYGVHFHIYDNRHWTGEGYNV